MRAFATLVLILSCYLASATHIVGGGFDMQWISGNTYNLRLVVYRDCSSQTPFNQNVYVGIYNKQNNLMVDSIGMPLGAVTKINPSGVQCAVQVPGCTERAEYNRIITLTTSVYNNTSGYYISWERCCRNSIIQNIQFPGDASMAFYAEIPSPVRYRNSTPRLVNNPFTVLCVDNLFTYPIQFEDADGDSLKYELITPVNGTLTRVNPNDDQSGGAPILNPGPYEPVVWNPGFSNAKEIDGNPPLSIHPKTGILRIKPAQTGVYVVGIRVTEFRNGVAIGFVHLELQFTVVNCLSNDFPDVKIYQNGNVITQDTLYVTIPDTLNFAAGISDKDGIDTFTLETNLDSSEWAYITTIPNITPISVGFSWKWRTHCEQHWRDTFKFTLTATDKGCPIPKTAQRIVNVKVLPMPLFPSTDMLCIELSENKRSKVYFGDSARAKPNFKQYTIYRAAGDDVFVKYDSIFDHQALFFIDNQTPDYASINYRYFIRVVNSCGFEGPSSDTLGTFEQLKYLPDKQYVYNATVVDDSKVLITWNRSKELDFARYFLWKGKRDQQPNEFVMEVDFAKVTDTIYLDEAVDVNNASYCYYLVMLDTCGNYGPQGQLFCTTLLSGKASYFSNQLTWQPFLYSDEQPFSYQLYKFAPSSPVRIDVGDFSSTQTETVDTKFNVDDGRYTYRVDVLHEPHGTMGVTAISTSNKVDLKQKPYIMVPNAFSPNRDAVNDTWDIHDVFVKDFHLRVYNRWGMLVFETLDKNSKWSGEDQYGQAITDTYIYVVTYTGWGDEVKTERGQVTVIR